MLTDFVCGNCVLQVIEYYSKKGLVANLHAEKPPKEVTVEVQKTLSWGSFLNQNLQLLPKTRKLVYWLFSMINWLWGFQTHIFLC